ncbi:hypothetical protein ASC91_25770 [Pelomonas sp. Root1237]|nr:hypothetical protein ASC91_25770 [Pelomonas sp. Root1237]
MQRLVQKTNLIVGDRLDAIALLQHHARLDKDVFVLAGEIDFLVSIGIEHASEISIVQRRGLRGRWRRCSSGKRQRCRRRLRHRNASRGQGGKRVALCGL